MLNKTKIEWADYTWNPVVGCRMCHTYCYARRINERFKIIPHFHKPQLMKDRLSIPSSKKSRKIFVCSMAELFGFWIPNTWIFPIIEIIKKSESDQFLFLTRFPERYREFNFPENCWLGATCNYGERVDKELRWNNSKNIKFISFEPLLANAGHFLSFRKIDWVIIGAQTNPSLQPKREWIETVISKAINKDIPIFTKNNLQYEIKHSDFPEV